MNASMYESLFSFIDVYGFFVYFFVIGDVYVVMSLYSILVDSYIAIGLVHLLTMWCGIRALFRECASESSLSCDFVLSKYLGCLTIATETINNLGSCIIPRVDYRIGYLKF